MHPKLIALLEQGFAQQQNGNLDAARNAYLEVLATDQGNEFALNLLGVVCIKKAEFAAAIGYLQQALRVNACDPETHNNLGLALKELRRLCEAEVAFNQSLRLRPNQPVTLNNLGNVLAAQDRHEQAIQHFEAALKLQGNFVDCLNNLSVSLKAVGRLEHALQTVQRAIDIDAGRSDSFNNKGEILLAASRYDEARHAFEKAIALDGNIVAKINLSTAQKQLGNERAAVESLHEVLSLEPDNTEAHNHLGVLHEQLGDTVRAARHFRKALMHAPNHASSYYQLSKLKDQQLNFRELAKINELLGDAGQPDIFRSSLYFALACDREKQGDFPASIQLFSEAQRIRAARHPYDPAAPAAYLQAVSEAYPVERKVQPEPAGTHPVPVFIVGMPRSGTTLTEQVISSHSAITGAGEVGYIGEIARQSVQLTGKTYPRSVACLTAAHVQQLRETYLARLASRHGNNRFISDKNPLNFNYIGLIATLFPEAKILCCQRDPMDNCVSIFRLPFDDSQGYSHDLAALGHYYRYHRQLMKFWRACYADQMLAVHYEQTVEDLERQARRILNFIGADFEDQVLRFFDNSRIVLTPSAIQVRRPIYNSSVNSWQKYGEALAPLQAALQD